MIFQVVYSADDGANMGQWSTGSDDFMAAHKVTNGFARKVLGLTEISY
jgi:hypothetical protein